MSALAWNRIRSALWASFVFGVVFAGWFLLVRISGFDGVGMLACL